MDFNLENVVLKCNILYVIKLLRIILSKKFSFPKSSIVRDPLREQANSGFENLFELSVLMYLNC